jgi:hypothetical protein
MPAIERRAAVQVLGIGPGAVERWFRTHGERARQANGTLLILAGTAGGLRAGLEIGSAGFIGRVVADPNANPNAEPDAAPHADPDSGSPIGTPWVPQAPRTRSFPRFAVAGVDAPASTAAAKRALHTRTGADVVDMESHAFAREAASRGIAFAILRGVSDGPDDALPDGLERLIHADGRTNWGGVAQLLLRRPTMLPTLRSLGRQSDAAMAAIAPLLAALLDEVDERGAPRP